MSKSVIACLSKRTILAALFAAALPMTALAATGNAMSSSAMGSSSESKPMMGDASHTTGSQTPAGHAGKAGSPWVKSIQAALNRKEHAHLAVDGKMGMETRTALEKFQKTHGLKATGKPNKATEHALGM